MRFAFLLAPSLLVAIAACSRSPVGELNPRAPLRKLQEDSNSDSGIKEYYNRFQSWAENAFNQVKDWAVRKFGSGDDEDEPFEERTEEALEAATEPESDESTKEGLRAVIKEVEAISKFIQTEMDRVGTEQKI